MKCKRSYDMVASESCPLHDSSFGVRSFTKSELASQSNVRSCDDLSSYKPIDATFCVVLQSHFLHCKALNPEGKILRTATIACIPSVTYGPSIIVRMRRLPCNENTADELRLYQYHLTNLLSKA